MKNIKHIIFNKVFIVSIITLAFSLGAVTDVGKNGKSLRKTNDESTEFFVFDINNIRVPVGRDGVIADVDPGDALGAYGQFDGKVFLYSAGFFFSGYANNKMFGTGVLSASRIQDYQPGPAGSNKNNAENRIYVVSQQDAAFGESWQNWRDAVSVGADYYDGTGDGQYDPVDLNGNGKWDDNEDRPDILGDVTAWCVYSDGVPAALRRFTVDPKGVEVHQSAFAFKSKSVIGNLLFLRYRIVNSGSVADTIYDSYFSAAADPDLGDYGDDLVGCDTTISAGYVYNDGSDTEYGDNPPCFLIDFFQGPMVSNPLWDRVNNGPKPYDYFETFIDEDGDGIYTEGVDTAIDTATTVHGQQIGIFEYPGWTNLPLTSMTQYMQSHPTHGDPNTHFEARNYQLGGLGKDGDPLSVGSWTFGNGSDLGDDTLTIPPRYMYSGDPVTGEGWINIEPIDQRIMLNTGPFNLVKGEPQDIYVAYVVGRGIDALHSITVTKEIDASAQKIFDSNFPAPPPPPPITYTVTSGDGFIDIDWETTDQVAYVAIDTVLFVEKKFEGHYLLAFRTPSKQRTISGVVNSKELIFYDLDNIIDNIYVQVANGNVFKLRDESDNKLDSLLYVNPETGRLRYRITSDPLTGGDLIKGHEYYFALGTYTLNHSAIVNKDDGEYGEPGDYIDPTNSAYEEYETKLFTVIYGDDDNNPALTGETGEISEGVSDGEVKYLVIEKEALTGDDYDITFTVDTNSTLYEVYWSLQNTVTGEVLIDSSTNFEYSDDITAGMATEGLLVKVKAVIPVISQLDEQDATYVSETGWAQPFNRKQLGGGYYVGYDIPEIVGDPTDRFHDPINNPVFPGLRTHAISADKARKIELRFGETSKAYRYLHAYQGGIVSRKRNYTFAEGITSADTVGRGEVGMWNTAIDRAMGVVDLPFAVYVVDEKYENDERRLAVGFLENSSILANGDPSGGEPDGIWDPNDALAFSEEVVFVFDEEYDEAGNKIYKGGYIDSEGEEVWADIKSGYEIPEDAAGVTEEERFIASQPFFNSMFVINFQRKINRDSTDASFWTAGDKLNIGVSSYPYTENDVYSFSTIKGGAVSEEDAKSNFDKVNVFPNPLFAYNSQTSYDNSITPDDPFVTFNHLPVDIDIKIYTISGILVRTLNDDDKSSFNSPFLKWNLKNESELRVASGMYIALIDSKDFGKKILKFSIILPEKQLRRY